MEIRAQDMEYKGRKVRVVVLRDITERIQAVAEREALLEEVRASHDELRTLAAYLQTALEDERTSIAREIHDEFGQHLTALKMDLAWLSTRITPAEPQVQEKMAVMTSMLQELIQHTRQVASNLRPGLLDDLGLNAAIEWYANDWSARHGKSIFIHLPDRELPLNREMSTAFYRILQETLTNVARHAEATRVDVYLEMGDDHVILQVCDNGRGISQKEIHSSTALGLLGMRERAYQFGGGLEISAKPGEGTTVQVRLPLKQGG
jgi:signal transduction histidine kinase